MPYLQVLKRLVHFHHIHLHCNTNTVALSTYTQYLLRPVLRCILCSLVMLPVFTVILSDFSHLLQVCLKLYHAQCFMCSLVVQRRSVQDGACHWLDGCPGWQSLPSGLFCADWSCTRSGCILFVMHILMHNAVITPLDDRWSNSRTSQLLNMVDPLISWMVFWTCYPAH